MHSITNVIANFAMGLTIVLGQLIGEGKKKSAGQVMGTGIAYFGVIGIVLSVLVALLAEPLSRLLNAPAEALTRTVSYVRICGIGFIVIMAYNLLGSIFRGIGDSKTPLIAVAIAAVINILGDLLLVAVFKMGAAGAAIATVFSELMSVVISILIIKKKKLPFEFHLNMVKFEGQHIKNITKMGAPLALQELLVTSSFLVITAIVNKLGLIESAGVGVAEKVCAFIMLVPSAFAQSMAACAAQNIGANQYLRARKSLLYAILISSCIGVCMFALSFFRGDLLCSIFSKDSAAIEKGAEYLKSYAIDCCLTCFMFCMCGFFNGIGMTKFTMLQGTLSAFCIRIPVAFFMSRITPVSLFLIGLATPCSTFVQIIMCLFALIYANKKYRKAN